MRRALLYVRQSDSDGAGERSLSLESQHSVLRQDAEQHEWQVIATIRDADLKGWDDRRPGLIEVYDRCRRRTVDVVAVWALDRLARSVRIQENVVHELDQLGVELWSHQESYVANPLFRQILGAVNEQRTRDIRAHVTRAMRERTSRGLHQGRVPWGYHRPDATSRLIVDVEAAPIIREMFELSAAGMGPIAIARLLIDRGILTPMGGLWSGQQVTQVLGRVAHRGAVSSGGTPLEGQHEPIVSVDLWRRAQRRDAGRRTPRRKETTSWLEGLIEHACGAPMYLSRAIPSHPHPEFRCRYASSGVDHARQSPCPYQPRIVQRDRAEEMAWERITRDLAALPHHERVLREARRRHPESAPRSAREHQQAMERKARAKQRRERALERYLAGDIERGRYDTELARALTEEREADALLAALPTMPDPELLEAAWCSLTALGRQLDALQGVERATLLRTLGMAIVSPHPISHGTRNWGQVTIRYRPDLAPFFDCLDT